MPLTSKGAKIKARMQKEYGKTKGTSVFYASANAGRIKDVHEGCRTADMQERCDKFAVKMKKRHG